jgi:beta-lactamase superfamily II metal-dependent hydrolase
LSIKKLIIGISIAVVLMLVIVLTLVLKPDLLTGLSETIKGTFDNTTEIVKTEPLPPVVNPVTTEPVEPMPVADAVRPEDNLKVYIPNTAGDFVVVTEGKDALVINGGFASDSENIKAFLAKIGVKQARYTVATNYLKSSVEGFPKMLTYLPSYYVLLSENVASKDLDKAVVAYLDKNKLIWNVPHNESTYKLGKANFELLKTHKKGSLFVLVTNGNTKMLFSGSTTKIEDGLVAKLPISVDLYAVASTNDKYSLNAGVMDKINAKNLVLNDMKNVDASKVTNAAKERELTLFRSTQCGDIVVGSNGTDIEVNCTKK